MTTVERVAVGLGLAAIGAGLLPWIVGAVAFAWPELIRGGAPLDVVVPVVAMVSPVLALFFGVAAISAGAGAWQQARREHDRGSLPGALGCALGLVAVVGLSGLLATLLFVF